MNKKELLLNLTSQLTEVRMKLNMCSYLLKQGIKLNENELNALIDKMNALEKVIAELEKD